ncbi:hypothetical protein CERSUDRAFT_119447, partial [Gelatoporia subvermispora B]
MPSSSCTRTTPCQTFTTDVCSGGLGVASAHNYLVTVTVRRWHSTVLYSWSLTLCDDLASLDRPLTGCPTPSDLRPAAGHAKGSSHLLVLGELRGCAVALVTQ